MQQQQPIAPFHRFESITALNASWPPRELLVTLSGIVASRNEASPRRFTLMTIAEWPRSINCEMAAASFPSIDVGERMTLVGSLHVDGATMQPALLVVDAVPHARVPLWCAPPPLALAHVRSPLVRALALIVASAALAPAHHVHAALSLSAARLLPRVAPRYWPFKVDSPARHDLETSLLVAHRGVLSLESFATSKRVERALQAGVSSRRAALVSSDAALIKIIASTKDAERFVDMRLVDDDDENADAMLLPALQAQLEHIRGGDAASMDERAAQIIQSTFMARRAEIADGSVRWLRTAVSLSIAAAAIARRRVAIEEDTRYALDVMLLQHES